MEELELGIVRGKLWKQEFYVKKKFYGVRNFMETRIIGKICQRLFSKKEILEEKVL